MSLFQQNLLWYNLLESWLVKQPSRYDIASNSWRFEADLPSLITGFKLIQVDGRPAIVGRFRIWWWCQSWLVTSIITMLDIFQNSPISDIVKTILYRILSKQSDIGYCPNRYGAEQTNRVWRYSEDKVFVTFNLNSHHSILKVCQLIRSTFGALYFTPCERDPSSPETGSYFTWSGWLSAILITFN